MPSELSLSVRHHLAYSLGLCPEEVTPRSLFQALALAVRDRMVDDMLETRTRYRRADAKRLYYLSMEFLIGRSLLNNLTNLGLVDESRAVLQEYGIDLYDVEETEPDAALGNGGLGRLAACFLDSLATLGMPGFGYGINYEFGLFKQEIRNGEQVEQPDNWRTYYSPWMIERADEAVLVPMYGRVEGGRDRTGQYNPMWLDWKLVVGVPHDMPIVGYGGQCVNYLRLYAARASLEVDMTVFNEGDYLSAVQQKVTSETISKVLYPSEIGGGRELRLVQEYFLVACAVRDIVQRYRKTHKDMLGFADKVAMQLNDTHPTLAIVELMRILIDEHDLPWEQAWPITTASFGYTNHTLLPEALERWPVSLLERVLPRHLEIIYEINSRFLKQVTAKWPNDLGRLERMSIFEEGAAKQARMAHLAIIGGHSVNGVAAVHSELVKTELVPDFYALWPEKFNNKTNGVTPRRWLLTANPTLAALITESIGDKWITDLEQLRGLDRFADDASFQEKFLAVKRGNQQRLAAFVLDSLGIEIDPDALFDVQVKRIHEYKRQLLNVLHIAHQYLELINGRPKPSPPRTFLFAGKAAPGYRVAKDIIRLINDVAKVINADPRSKDLLRVAFIPDYRVSLAERIIPAADLSEQISTAGTEASGTGNMKFAMNGALTIGTLDGANIEIREEVGAENFFLFGLTVPEVRQLQASGPYRPREISDANPRIRRIMDAFQSNLFCPNNPGHHAWVSQRLLATDERYLHIADLESYLTAQTAAGKLYLNRKAWAAAAIRNVARVGKFSSDRTIREYASGIWGIKAVGG